MTQNSSKPPELWSFKEALDLLAAFDCPTSAQDDEPPRTPPSPSPLYEANRYDPKSQKPAGLGDFNRLFSFLGVEVDTLSTRTHESTEFSSSSASDKSTPPSSLPEDVTKIEDFVGKGKEVRWTDEVAGNNIAQFRRRSTHNSSSDLDPALLGPIFDDSDMDHSTPSQNTRSRRKSQAHHLERAFGSEVESDGEYQRASRRFKQRRMHLRNTPNDDHTPLPLLTASATLIPSSVAPNRRPIPTHTLWVPPPIPTISLDRSQILPIYTLTRAEKYIKLIKKLQKKFNLEPDVVVRMKADHATGKYGGNNSASGIHLFVDCSNIVIGFVNELKARRGMNVRSPARGAVISWHTLALILERGRSVARRIVVGSHGSPLDLHEKKLPDYFLEAERCGYEVNVLDRVVKTKDLTPKKKGGHGNGYATASGYSSGSDGAYMRRKAVAEQGVDEILHMKLLESLIDTKEPSTIVLASGDAAEAEYSGGFLKNVERALTNGWKVELVAWSATLSKEYQSEEFLRRWKGRFSIVLLDDFSEELLAVYTASFKPPKDF